MRLCLKFCNLVVMMFQKNRMFIKSLVTLTLIIIASPAFSQWGNFGDVEAKKSSKSDSITIEFNKLKMEQSLSIKKASTSERGVIWGTIITVISSGTYALSSHYQNDRSYQPKKPLQFFSIPVFALGAVLIAVFSDPKDSDYNGRPNLNPNNLNPAIK